MPDANKALAEVRSWLCNNLRSSDAGKVCGMLSVVSRHINELESENAKLRELVTHYERPVTVHDVKPVEVLEWSVRCDALRKELGIGVGP